MSVTASQRPHVRKRSKPEGAQKAPMPGFIEQCDPTLRERALAGSNWAYEIKSDGYRAQVQIHN